LQERYSIIEEVGRGCYSTVYKAIDPQTNQRVAIKHVKVFDKLQGLPQAFFREVAQLRQLNNENIVKLQNVFVDCNNETYLVLEYCDYDLETIIRSNDPGRGLPIQFVKSYFKQLLRAVLECHKHNIVHRDIKPANILVTRDNVVKLTDFGLSRNFSTSSSNKTYQVVSPGYKAPEIILGDPDYSYQTDIWSLGAVLYEMITGIKLFTPITPTDASQLTAIIKILGKPTECDFPNYHKMQNFDLVRYCVNSNNHLNGILRETLDGEFAEAITLIEGMLCYNPQQRITIEEALSHPFLADEDSSFIDPFKLPELFFEESHSVDLNVKYVLSSATFSSAETSPIRPQRLELVPILV
jgi:serine/threonine protein kinase